MDIRVNSLNLTVRIAVEGSSQITLVRGDGLPVLTLANIWADPLLLQTFTTQWVPEIVRQVERDLRTVATNLGLVGNDLTMAWLRGLRGPPGQPIPVLQAMDIGNPDHCPHCRETPCYTRKYFIVFLVHARFFIIRDVYGNNETMAGRNLRKVRALMYRIPNLTTADPMRRAFTLLGQPQQGPWFEERSPDDGRIYVMVPNCVRGFMIRLIVEGNIRFTHLVP